TTKTHKPYIFFLLCFKEVFSPDRGSRSSAPRGAGRPAPAVGGRRGERDGRAAAASTPFGDDERVPVLAVEYMGW
ncbi:hypothetical protein ACWEO1_34385, partial [Kitasatospora cineracea]